MSVDGFRRTGRPEPVQQQTAPVRAVPVAEKSLERIKKRASSRRLGRLLTNRWSRWWLGGRQDLKRWFSVMAAGVAFFSGLSMFLIQPPGAQATISTGDGITIYGSTQTGKTLIPQTRNYAESTDAFDAQADTQSGGGTAQNFAIKTSPIKTEAIAAYEYSGGTIQVMCFDGTNWSNEWTATTLNNSNVRTFDISYESSSGDVVILYGTGASGSNELAYRTKPGTAACGSANWSSATNVSPARTSGTIDWVDMQSNPNSDMVAAIWADSNRDLSAMTWNGSSWSNEPSSALDTNLAYISSSTLSDTEAFDLAFESVSGNLMVVWGTGGSSTGTTNLIKYARCTGGTATCSWTSTSNMPTVADAGNHLDMSANPQTNEIVFGAMDRSTDDLSIGYWSGTAWTNSANMDTTCEPPTAGRKLVTANWMINGSTTRSIIMYADNSSQTIDYFLGNGSNFGTANVGSHYAPTPTPSTTTRYYKSRKDPYHLNRVMLEYEDNANDLYAEHAVMSAAGVVTWSDSGNNSASNFTGALNRNISSSTAGPFGFAYWQYVPEPGPSKINQDGYIFENDDQVPVGGNTTDADTVQAVGSTAITGVRQGERFTVRFHLRNTGVDPLTGSLGLFYDRNDGYFVKADDHAPPNTAAGNCTDTIYSCAVVDNTAGTNTGQYASMAFDNSGQAWVSYYDATNTDLVVAKYVGYGGTGCGTSGSSAWQCSVVDKNTATTLGQYTSMGFDGSGHPWVSYYDATNTNLKVATLHTDPSTTGTGCGSGGSTLWDCTTVDSTANSTGTNSSIAFDQSGNAGVAYQYDNGSLKGIKYATYVGSGGTGCAVTTWTCYVVDEGSASGQTYTSIQYDHANKPWIAYYDIANTSLHVANYVGGTNGTGCGATGSTAWTCTEVDNTGTDTGSYPNLMFGPTGNAWVSYYDTSNTALKIATKGGGYGSACTGSGWTCGTVDNTGSVGQYSSLAQDASGKVIVSYNDASNTAMRVARYAGSGGNCTDAAWNCGIVDNTGTSTGQYTTAAAAPDGNLWVAYYDPTNTSLRAAQVTRGGEVIPSAGIAGTSPATIQYSHADVTTTNAGDSDKSDADCLTAGASWNNGVWGSGSEAQSNSTSSTTSILPAGNVAAQCTEVAFTIDTSHATAGATYRLLVASSNSDRADHGVWRGPASVAAYATFTMQASGVASQRFSKDTNPSFPTCDGNSAWGCEAVQSTNNVGQYTSLAFDPAGVPWMTYYDASNTALRLGHYVGSGGTGCANTQWTCITMENQANHTTGQYNSIAFGKDGTPWVAYRDSNGTGSGGLKVAKRVSASGTCASIGGSSQWDCTRIDTGSGGSTAQYTSIAMSPSGNPWIAFYDNTNIALVIARYVGSNGTGCNGQPSPAWTCSVVDWEQDDGQSANLAFDSSGTAWISYYDATDGWLKAAHYVGSGGTGCTSTEWTCTNIDGGAGDAGVTYTSMSFDTTGKPYISFYDATFTQLRVAQYVGSGGTGCDISSAWTCTTVDDNGSVGQYSSLAFDATGKPWVSYYDATNADLKVAQYVGTGGNCTSTAWNCGTINTGGTVGQYTSLAFDHSGDPWVGYYDASNLDVKIAKQSMPTAKPMNLETTPAGPRNGRMDDARWHLDNGLAPRSSTGNCNATTNDMGYCGTLNTDGYYDTLYSNPNEQPFFIFGMKRSDNTSPTFVQWTGASDVAAATANIKMEVYNITSKTWETVATNTDCAAGSACRLAGSPSGTLSDYYESAGGGTYFIYFRVSQAANTSGGLFQTDSFIFAPTTDLLMRHGQWFDPSGQLADRSQPFFWAQ